MKGLVLLLIHLLVVLARVAGPGGTRELVAENLLLKQQLIVGWAQRRAPNLSPPERFVPGLCTLFITPSRFQGFCRREAVDATQAPGYLSTDHDPLFRYHRWQANLRILDIEPIKSVPYTPVSHPFVERLIGTHDNLFVGRPQGIVVDLGNEFQRR